MLQDAVRRQIDRWELDRGSRLWQPGDTLVVGVSGGPDSLALLHMLARNGLHSPQNLVVGHLDHRLRPSSGDEARTVAAKCEQWGVKCIVKTVDVTTLAHEERLSIEEASRVARYEFLGSLAIDVGSECVLVGHTADDQVETVLMHFVRGTGLDGLRGMLPVAPLSGYRDLSLVRPMLSITRHEIMDYCATNRLDPIFDPSNEEEIYFRNRLRHELLPILESYNPQIRERLLRTAEVVRADVNYLNSRTGAVLESLQRERTGNSLRLELGPWRQLPLSLRRRTLREAVWRLRQSMRDVSFAPIEQARLVAERGAVGARSSLPGNLELQVEYDTLVLRDPSRSPELLAPQLPPDHVLELPVPGRVILPTGWQLRADVSARRAFVEDNESHDRWREYVDADSTGPLFVRARRPGERMQPLGLHGSHAKVSDIMIDAKLPAHLRARWPLVTNEHHPVWLVGIRLDDRVRIKKGTQRVIQLRCDDPGVDTEA